MTADADTTAGIPPSWMSGPGNLSMAGPLSQPMDTLYAVNNHMDHVTMDFHGRHPVYAVKTLNHGYRFEVTFKNSQSSDAAATIAIGSHKKPTPDNIKNVLTAQNENEIKVDVLASNGKSMITVLPSTSGYRIYVKPSNHLNPAQQVTNTIQRVKHVQQTPKRSVTNQKTTIQTLHFTRGLHGSGLLHLNISGKQPNMSILHQSKNTLVLQLHHSDLPKSLSHRYGVRQFGSIVNEFDAYPLDHSVELVFHTNDNYHYSAYQLGNKIMVRLYRENITSASHEKRVKLSMDFQSISTRDAIQVIADFTHQNIVVSNSVTGNMSIQLKDEPWTSALRVIMDSQGLAMRHVGSILWIAPAQDIAAQEKISLTNAAEKQKLEPLVTSLIPIKYASASQIATLLRGFSKDNQAPMSAGTGQMLAQSLGIPSSRLIGNSLLGKRGSVAVVTRTNSLLIRDTPSDIANIRKLIHKIDKPVPQVLIAARIVQITTNAAKSLGVQWGGTYTSNGAGGLVNLSGTSASGVGPSQGGGYSMNGGSGRTGFSVPSLINLPASAPAGSALAGLNPASIGMALGTTAGNRILSLQLQALQADNKAKIISSPKVMTQDNEKAIIEQGAGNTIPASTSSGATAVSFKKAELSLEVTPHISPDGKVTMTVDAKNNQPNYADASPSGIPIDTQEVKTKLLVNNGQTIVIGGIYTETRTVDNSGIPVLKNIPLMGWLFKSHTVSMAKTELLVFLRPEIIGLK